MELLMKNECEICGCRDGKPCKGGCYWELPNLCSNHKQDMNKHDFFLSLGKQAKNLEDYLALYGIILLLNEIGEKNLRKVLIKHGKLDKDVENLIAKANRIKPWPNLSDK